MLLYILMVPVVAIQVPGGWGVVLIYKGIEKEISGGQLNTTNNKMEITAVVKGLEILKEPCNVKVYSDSAYVVNSIKMGWIYSWKENNWVKKDKSKVKNIELWEGLLELISYHNVEFIKVKGHADNKYNNRCDMMAVKETNKLKI